MPAFHYQAYNSQGKTLKGVIEADSLRHAREKLKEKSLFPINIGLMSKKEKTHVRGKLSADDLTLMTRQLATMISAAIPIEEALLGVSEQTEKPKARAVIAGIRSKVLEGYGLHQAMKEFPESFPDIYIATISSGEQTGKLDIMLEELANYTERQQQIKQKVQQALIYPTIMIGISILIVSFLLTFVVPKIIDVFSSSGQPLPTMTMILMKISHGIKNYGIAIVILIIGLTVLVRWLIKKPRYRTYWDKMLLRIPLLSKLHQTVNIARYLHTFAILFSSGVTILETMRVATTVINNTVLRQPFLTAMERVREGESIGEALKNTKCLPPMATHLIRSGEKSGQLAPMMQKAAMHMDNETERFINTGLTLLEPLVILIMGAMVMFIVLATLVPIFSMEQLVS